MLDRLYIAECNLICYVKELYSLVSKCVLHSIYGDFEVHKLILSGMTRALANDLLSKFDYSSINLLRAKNAVNFAVACIEVLAFYDDLSSTLHLSKIWVDC